MVNFNVGDRVRMIRKGQYSFDRVGKTGTVVGIKSDRLLEITVDGECYPMIGNGWTYWIENENWELLKEEAEVQQFKVGDKVRMVRLRSDGLSYSFDKIGNEGVVKGIVLGYIMVDVHCKDNTWEGNGWSYPLENKCWEVIEEEKEMSKCKFKVGDLVKGNDPRRYIITNDKMVKAKVLDVYGCDYIRIKILEHLDADYKNFTPDEFDVDPQYFDLYEEPKKEVKVTPQFKVGDKVKVLDELYGHEFNIGQVVEIVEICHDEELLNDKNYNYECRSDEGEIWYLDDTEIELVQNEKPKTTVLKLGEYKIVFNGDTTVVTDGTRNGVAKRHPDDEYSAIVGLQVAIERFNGGRKPRIGDKVRVLKVDLSSRYGRHSYSVGEIVTVINFANSDTDVCCKDSSSFRQTLIAGEYEVLG